MTHKKIIIEDIEYNNYDNVVERDKTHYEYIVGAKEQKNI